MIVIIIGILAGVSFPFYHAAVSNNDLSIATTTLAQSMRRAQAFSYAGEQDSAWGVKIEPGEIIVFAGDSYVARDTDYDQTTSINDNLTTSGLTEVVYSKTYALPQTTGTTTFESPVGAQKQVSINIKGMITY